VKKPNGNGDEPRIERHVPFEVYRQINRVHITALKDVGHSPLLYKYLLTHQRETKAMTLGSASHTAILEPHRFLSEYALWDARDEKGRVRPRQGKEFEAFAEEAKKAKRRVLRAVEYELAMAMRDAVRSHPVAIQYLTGGAAEVIMLWNDQETGRPCKGRSDWLQGTTLVGIKSARDCRPIQFGNAAAKLGYHLQWAFYHDGHVAITGKEPLLIEIVVENTPPYDVAVYRIPAEVIEQGRDEYRKLLLILAECESSGVWPGAVVGEQILTLPSWVYQADSDLSELGLEV
jgi:hypothetical protein